ncbi:MAG: amino acid ABC transporter permease [Pseudonocardiaceae bacterium]
MVLYLQGMGTTAVLSLVSYALALLVGVVIAGFRVSPILPLRWVGAFYVETIRNTPLLVLMFLFVFGVTKLGILFGFFASAVIVLGGYTGALVAETIRAGINSVAVGQAEAARALGLTFPQILSRVILPQALRTVVGPLGGLFVALIKNSALASIISVVDLTGVADRVTTATARPLEAFGAAGIAYVVLAIPAGVAFGWLERHVAIRR